jgi:excisionase family DNA binding protein
MTPETTTPLVPPTVLADRVGVHERTIRRMCDRGEIPGAIRVGKKWRVPADALTPAPSPRTDATP